MGNSPSAIKNMDDLSDEDLPIMLDCGHIFSNSSLNQLYDEQDNEIKCPECNFAFTKDIKLLLRYDQLLCSLMKKSNTEIIQSQLDEYIQTTCMSCKQIQNTVISPELIIKKVHKEMRHKIFEIIVLMYPQIIPVGRLTQLTVKRKKDLLEIYEPVYQIIQLVYEEISRTGDFSHETSSLKAVDFKFSLDEIMENHNSNKVESDQQLSHIDKIALLMCELCIFVTREMSNIGKLIGESQSQQQYKKDILEEIELMVQNGQQDNSNNYNNNINLKNEQNLGYTSSTISIVDSVQNKASKDI